MILAGQELCGPEPLAANLPWTDACLRSLALTLGTAAQDSDAGVRLDAVRSLWAMGPDAVPALPNLAAGLRDADPLVGFTSAMALARIGELAVPVLSDALGAPMRRCVVSR